MSTLLGLAAILGLILANAAFVAAEFAYVAVRRTRLEEAAGQGDAAAARALAVLDRLSFVLSGAQLGITATSLVLGWLAAPVIATLLDPLFGLTGLGTAARAGTTITVALVLATTAQMIFGELAPKNLAIAEPEAFARALAGPTRTYTRLAGPLIALFDGAANRLLRATGIEPVEAIKGGVSPEELGFIIEASSSEGELSGSQAALLGRVLELRQLDAADVMVPRPQIVSLPVDATCEDLRQLAVRTGHSRFPVYDDERDEYVGIVQAKAVLAVPPDQRASTPARALLRPAVAIPERAPAGGLIGELRRARTQLALVVDEFGSTAGIVTLEDVVEELVGSIRDEYDLAEAAARALPDGSWEVPGAWRIDEVARDIGVALPEGEYDTVGGLLMERLGRIPEAGDAVVLETATLHVEAMSGNAVERVRIVAVGDDETGAAQAPDGSGQEPR